MAPSASSGNNLAERLGLGDPRSKSEARDADDDEDFEDEDQEEEIKKVKLKIIEGTIEEIEEGEISKEEVIEDL